MFTGKMTSGKTSLANHLVVHRGFTRIALADPIKEIEIELGKLSPIEITNKHMAILDPMQKAMFCKILEEAERIPRETPKPRKRLQFIGTEGARQRISDDIWIRLGDYRASQHQNVCIDDIRFPNEFDYFRSKDWISVAVLVSLEVQWKRLTTLYGDIDPSILQHASETGIEEILARGEYDYWVDTSDTTVDEAGDYLMEIMNL